MKCPICKGEGEIYDAVLWWEFGCWDECNWCGGEGEVRVLEWIKGWIKRFTVGIKKRKEDIKFQ